jgi:subtilase family serine protease
LPLTHQATLEQLLIDQTNPASSSYHKWLTPAEFGAKFGPDPAAFAAVKARLQSAGLTVTKQHTQSIEVEGSVRDVEALLSMHIENVRTADGKIKQSAANHQMALPRELVAAGAMIPAFAPHLARHIHSERLAAMPVIDAPGYRFSNTQSWYYPNDMAEAYAFPSFLTTVTPAGGPAKQITGAGSTIGILMSSTIDPADVADDFYSGISFGPNNVFQLFPLYTSVPVPTVTVKDVDGGSGAFGNDAAAEASLDTQMSLGTAPGAHEILYNIPDLSDGSIIDGYTQIVDDNLADVVSSSFGGCELAYTAAANGGTDFTFLLQLEHNIYVQGNAQGITFLASSGDNGAAACYPAAFYENQNFSTDYVLGVESPASDPNVTGVGGTNLVTTATPGVDDARYSSENANYDPRVAENWPGGFTVGNNTWGSGGGYSIVFGKPSYQALVNTGSSTARAVPDVSLQMGGCPGDADLTAQDCTTLPRSASFVWIGGGPALLIGTSSSSPQMAGVMALYDEAHGGRQGNINPLIYQLSALQTSASAKTASLSQYFHRAISGNNNGFTVVPGQAYSKVLGNGTLFVKTFLQLPSAAAAGAPNTVTNP